MTERDEPLEVSTRPQRTGKAVSRREFLRGVSVAGAAVAGTSMLGSPAWGAVLDSAKASSRPAAAQSTVDFTFLEFFTGELWTGLFQGIVAQFEEESPHIKWTGIPVNYNQLPAKFLTLSAGGDPPDGTSIDNLTFPASGTRRGPKPCHPH